MQLKVYLQKSVPIRPAGIHLINAGPIISFLSRIATGFLPEKIRQRVFCHSNLFRE